MSRITEEELDMLGKFVSLFPLSFTMFTDGNWSKNPSAMSSVWQSLRVLVRSGIVRLRGVITGTAASYAELGKLDLITGISHDSCQRQRTLAIVLLSFATSLFDTARDSNSSQKLTRIKDLCIFSRHLFVSGGWFGFQINPWNIMIFRTILDVNMNK